MVSCETVEEEKCEDVTEGYTTTKKCQKWPKQQCTVTKETTTKYTTMTGCHKEPTELCAPAGCGFTEVIRPFDFEKVLTKYRGNLNNIINTCKISSTPL